MSDERGESEIPAAVLAMLKEALSEIKVTLKEFQRDMNSQLSKLPDIYVPRREVEHRFDEHTIDIGELRNQLGQKTIRHDADVQRIEDRIEAAEKQRDSDRKWAFGAAVSLAGLMLTSLGIALAALTQLR